MRCKKCEGVLRSVKSKITRETQICGKCRRIKTGPKTRRYRKPGAGESAYEVYV